MTISKRILKNQFSLGQKYIKHINKDVSKKHSGCYFSPQQKYSNQSRQLYFQILSFNKSV